MSKTSRNIIFDNYKLKKKVASEFYSDEINDLSIKITDLIKQKKLTYEEAYAVLNLAYSQLEYESKYAKVPRV